jgi:hypothetical protein
MFVITENIMKRPVERALRRGVKMYGAGQELVAVEGREFLNQLTGRCEKLAGRIPAAWN